MPEFSIMKSERKRLRRKLQKIGPDPTVAMSKVTGFSFAAFSPNKRLRLDSENRSDFQVMARKSQPRLQLPENLRDHEWLKDLQGTGYFYPDPNSKRKSEIHPLFRGEPESEPIPEFAHLALQNHSQQPTTTLDDLLPPPRRSLGTRRYAKTPVTRVGQLEGRPVRTPSAAPRGANAELIAASYRAMFKDSCLDLRALHNHSAAPEPLQTPNRNSVMSPVLNSPISDDGTLVGFEEDTIFFKPISFTPPPSLAGPSEPSTPAIREQSDTTESPASGNPGLEICFDLLAQELTSAARKSTSPGLESSSLQIWVMIEAYEKLRDQILQGQPEASASAAMFDTWIKALYSIHDDMMDKKQDFRMSSGSTKCGEDDQDEEYGGAKLAQEEEEEYGGMIAEELD